LEAKTGRSWIASEQEADIGVVTMLVLDLAPRPEDVTATAACSAMAAAKGGLDAFRGRSGEGERRSTLGGMAPAHGNDLGPLLLSNGPHPDPRDSLFDPFIGSWDLHVTWFDESGGTRTMDGEWHFAWVLEGRAVQDVWIVPRRDQRRDAQELYEYGTSIRFPSDRPGCWHSTWLGPMQRSVHEFVASRDGADIVLDTTHDDGREMRWRFTDITERSFSWSNATRIGDEWVVTQRFAATRAGSVPTPP
jgi:hypothetical protein